MVLKDYARKLVKMKFVQEKEKKEENLGPKPQAEVRLVVRKELAWKYPGLLVLGSLAGTR